MHCVLLEQETLVAALPPKKNSVAPEARSNPVPLMVTRVPPAGVPEEGEIELSDGMYVKVAEPDAACPLTVPVTVTVPAPAGEIAVQVLLLEQETPVAGLDPKLKVVAPATNPLPVTVSCVPPLAGPVVGVIELRTCPAVQAAR